MAHQEIVDLIKKSIEQGVGREQLVSDLIFAGFAYREIQGAINEMARQGQLPAAFFEGTSRRMQRVYQGPKVKKIGELAQESREAEATAGEIARTYRKRIIIFVAVLIAAFALVSGGLYFYGTLPSVVVKRALSNLSDTQSFGYYLKANVAVDKSGMPDFVTDKLFGEEDTIESRGIVDYSVDYLEFSSEISAGNGFDSTQEPFWGIGLIFTAPSDWFFKLNSISSTASQDAKLAEQLSLGWVKVDSPPESLSGLMPQKILSQLSVYRNLNSSQVGQLVKIASDPALISSIVSAGTETIGGSNYYRYRISFDKNKAGQITGQFYGMLGKTGGPLLSVFDNPWDVWITKNNPIIYRIKYSFGTDISGYTFNLRDFDLYLSGFDQNPPVSEPAQYNLLSHVLEIIKE
jgi:hypothetical protein